MSTEDIVKKGTTTVAMMCKDGVVLAADKRATAGTLIANKYVEKIQSIADNIAVTTAGTVSDFQLIIKLIRAELALKQMRIGKEATVKEASNLLQS